MNNELINYKMFYLSMPGPDQWFNRKNHFSRQLLLNEMEKAHVYSLYSTFLSAAFIAA